MLISAYMFVSIAFQGASTEVQQRPPKPENSISPDTDPRPLLWKGLRVGMPPEEAAALLRAIDGVKAVKVKGTQKSPRLSISLTDGALDVADWKVTIGTDFDAEGLESVALSQDDCASITSARILRIIPVLKERYGNAAMEKVVDSNGVEISTQAAFWNATTRVRVSWVVSAIGEYVDSGLSGKTGRIADALGALGMAAQRAACPADEGAKAAATITYSSQAAFLNEQKADIEKAERERQKARTQF